MSASILLRYKVDWETPNAWEIAFQDSPIVCKCRNLLHFLKTLIVDYSQTVTKRLICHLILELDDHETRRSTGIYYLKPHSCHKYCLVMIGQQPDRRETA